MKRLIPPNEIFSDESMKQFALNQRWETKKDTTTSPPSYTSLRTHEASELQLQKQPFSFVKRDSCCFFTFSLATDFFEE